MPPPAIEEPAEDEVAPAPPPPQRVAPKRRKVSRTDPSVHGEEGGCFSTLLIMLLFIGSMLIGLAIRHNQETDRNLFSDLIDKMTGSMPKIKFEKRVDEE